MKILLYHGGTEIIKFPYVNVGRDNLDFGRGFYLTDLKEQAVRWALAVATRRRKDAVINIYEFDKDAVLKSARCKIFKAYDEEWLNFIVANRRGEALYKKYDYIEGGVADDRVIDTINLYIVGLMSADVALKRLAQYKPNNQICILNQAIIDKYMTYYGTETAK